MVQNRITGIQGVPGGMGKTSGDVPYVELYRYNPKHLYPKLNGYGDNGQRSLKLLTAVTHLLITKYILKLAGICDFCNVNICT